MKLLPLFSRKPDPREQAMRDLERIVRETRERNRGWAYRRRDQLAGERRKRFEEAMGI